MTRKISNYHFNPRKPTQFLYPLMFSTDVFSKIQSGEESYGLYMLYKNNSDNEVEKLTIRVDRIDPVSEVDTSAYDSAEVIPLSFESDALKEMIQGVAYEIVIQMGGSTSNMSLLLRKRIKIGLN